METPEDKKVNWNNLYKKACPVCGLPLSQKFNGWECSSQDSLMPAQICRFFIGTSKFDQLVANYRNRKRK